jgi:hypothetical protein
MNLKHMWWGNTMIESMDRLAVDQVGLTLWMTYLGLMFVPGSFDEGLH